MSMWSTKATGRDRELVVLQHRLKGVNYVVNGVKFRDGYAVVEKNSKVYRSLLQMPVLKGAKEFPLLFLRKLPFITRTVDVKNVFGQEVYTHYLKELDVFIQQQNEEKQQQDIINNAVKEEEHVQTKCSHRLDSGKLCSNEAVEFSPSSYCTTHFLEDPKFAEMGIQIPRFMTKKEKLKLKEKLTKQFAEMKKEGKL